MKENRNRFTIIDNDLIDAFAKINLSPYEWRVIFAIIRYSYGWNKETAQLTCTQLSQLTGIDVRLIPRTLKSLQKKNIIVRNKNIFQLQKDYRKWFSSVEMSSVEMKSFICRDENSSSAEMKTTAKKPSKINNLQHAKYIFKNIYNNLSNIYIYNQNIYRERFCKR